MTFTLTSRTRLTLAVAGLIAAFAVAGATQAALNATSGSPASPAKVMCAVGAGQPAGVVLPGLPSPTATTTTKKPSTPNRGC